MMGSKEAELTSAVMLYAIRCLAEGDQSALRSMNFGPREVDALREMNFGDLCRIETLRAHCLRIALNREVYWPMVAHLRHSRESEELQKTLISADAPLEMMQTFFGMSGREYARLRRMLVVETITGRPPQELTWPGSDSALFRTSSKAGIPIWCGSCAIGSPMRDRKSVV